jgi:serine/threonine-protein kinase RsbW
METRFPRALSSLAALFAMSQEFCARNDVDQSGNYALDVVLEEIFTNLVRHGSKVPDEILVNLDRRGSDVVLSVTDFDAERFDLRDATPPDTTLPLADRQPGGLGLHLIRKLVDRVDYEHHDRTGTITIHKKVG